MKIEYALGSAAHYRDLAHVMRDSPDGIDLGPSDTELCAKALAFLAGRRRHLGAFVAVLTLVAALCVGVPDVNGDGQVSLADLGAAVRMIVLGA